MQEDAGLPPDQPKPLLSKAYECPSNDDGIVVAEVVESAYRKPRIWTALCVGLLTLPLLLMVSIAVPIFAAIVDRGPDVFTDDSFPRWFETYSQTRLGLVVLVLPGQAALVVMAVGAALLSPQRASLRLGLCRGVLPLWTWVVFILATPIVAIFSSQVLSWLVDEPSEHLRMMEQIMKAHADEFLVGLLLIVAVVPGLAEELMFRGYIQTRLAERWHPVAAVGVTAIMFSVVHLDPLHMLGVVPLGLWLGAVAWRADSIVPAMLCHAFNNALAVAATKYGQMPTLEVALDPMTKAALAISLPAFLLSLYIFRSD